MATDLVTDNKSFHTSVAFILKNLYSQCKCPSEQQIMIIISKFLDENNFISNTYTLHPVPKGELPDVILSFKEYVELSKYFDEPSEYNGAKSSGLRHLREIIDNIRMGKLECL